MKELDENTALSIIFGNTKRKKRSVDLLTVAKSCDYLAKLYGSQKAVGERVNLHSEMIRQFRSLLRLPDEIKEMISSRKIDRLDVAYRIAMIGNPKEQIVAARAIADLDMSKDIRDIIKLSRKSSSSIEDSKRRVIEAKPEGLHIFIMDFDEKTYSAIHTEAKKAGMEAAELVKKIVDEWFRNKRQTMSED